MTRTGLGSCLAVVLIGSYWTTNTVGQEALTKPTLAAAELGATKNVHSFGLNLLCGQPTAEDFAEAKRRGIKTIITLRQEGEVSWDEPGRVKDLGMAFHRIAFLAPDTLTDAVLDKTLKLLSDTKLAPVMLHCGSANRVGAIWLAHRVLNDDLPLEAARKEAMTVGLRTAGYEDRAVAYIKRMQSESSVKPGINDRFVDPTLDVSEWLGRFEIESREVYSARETVLEACAIKPGYSVADIGAGTGFYSRLFASAVGDNGWVYAVDISPRFLEHINNNARDDKIGNLTSVLCSDRSVRLPPNSVDLVFTCDTYHHFEHPQSTLASIYRALKPGGTLVVIDFERIPGKSREFILGHLRAGKDVFQREIINAGFRFVEEIKVPAFKENYLLRFRKE